MDVRGELEGWLRGKNAPPIRDLATSVFLLVHESMHLRGITDESAADCTALKLLPTVLRKNFGVKKAATMKTMMAAAWAAHRASSAEYKRLC